MSYETSKYFDSDNDFYLLPPHKASPRVFGPTLICQLGLPPSLTLVQLEGRQGNKQGCRRASDSRVFPWVLWGGGDVARCMHQGDDPRIGNYHTQT